jgi:adenine-specific DNA-methyltransferase
MAGGLGLPGSPLDGGTAISGPIAYNFLSTMPKLDWLTRPEDERVAASVPYRLLEAVPELSYGDEQTENMLIQGDNLEALKALLPFYAGRVKCIFIDPPYNTRSAEFAHYDDNLEHSQWLGMMYPRLELLRKFLTEDGSIWVTIDDNEAHYLKVIMDEVFGRKNFVANVVWRSSDNSNNDAKTFSVDHNHILVYSRSQGWHPNKQESVEEKRSHFKNPDNNPRGAWFDGNPLNSPKPRENLMYDIQAPNGNVIKYPKNGWRWERETLEEKLSTGEIRFNPDMTNIIRRTYLEDMKGLPPSTLWIDLLNTGHNRQAKSEQKKLFGSDNLELFSTPKPEKLLYVLLQAATYSSDLVLDSFLGSGTTAAVAHKMGRRYIGIEIGEHAETHCVPRLRKVVDGEQGGISETVGWTGGGGFRFYRLGSPIFDEQGHINPAIRFDHLAAHVWFSETRTPLPHKRKRSPLLGKHGETAYYLLYNGILGDKRPDGGNVLTRKVLGELPAHDGPKVIYGESSRLSAATLKQLGIIFKQTPYDVKAR